MKKEEKIMLTLSMISLLFPTSITCGTTWDMSDEYSKDYNPNGIWSYGRKWSPESSGFDLFTHNMYLSTYVWWFGNVGHGGPAVQAGPNLWAKNNTNGLPVVRWTCPESNLYNLNCKFVGNDSRGVDVYTYVAINNSMEFSDHVQGYLDTTEFSLDEFYLEQNDTIDFMIEWTGAIYYETSWTAVTGTITQVPEPATMTLLAFGSIVFYRNRRSFKVSRNDSMVPM